MVDTLTIGSVLKTTLEPSNRSLKSMRALCSSIPTMEVQLQSHPGKSCLRTTARVRGHRYPFPKLEWQGRVQRLYHLKGPTANLLTSFKTIEPKTFKI